MPRNWSMFAAAGSSTPPKRSGIGSGLHRRPRTTRSNNARSASPAEVALGAECLLRASDPRCPGHRGPDHESRQELRWTPHGWFSFQVALTGFGAAETSERECSIHGAAMAYRLTILAAVTKLAAM